jgi:hypothetical protein
MRSKTMFLLAIIGVLALCLSMSQPAIAASDEEEVLQIVSNVAKAFNTADYELMSSLFWHSSKTSSFGPAPGYPFLYQGWESLETWWKGILGLPAGTFSSSFHNTQVTILDDNTAILTCYQTLVVNPPMVKEQTVFLIRGTFVVQKINGKWLVVHDHGSQLPVT